MGKVVITGAAGWTAAAIWQLLWENGADIFGIDLPHLAGAQHSFPFPTAGVDLGAPADLAPLFAGSEALIHLAVAVGEGDYEDPHRPFETNVQGTYRVLDAARRAGTPRTVLIGSAPVHLVGAWPGRLDARTDCHCGPGGDFLYDLTKCLQEQIARQFAAAHGMRVVTLRAGHLVDGAAGLDPRGRPLESLDYARGGWVDRGDLARAVLAALNLEGEGYEAFHVIGSRSARSRFDLARSESDLGWSPRYDFAGFDL